ncbi:DUF6660 family protein [Olivibacter sp. XZL3]|uniref:DUF6660 family protein n=1 Tax=Olivibacter sp. XZL3 TaxID=1735116 RepID=UPI00351A812B
MKVLISILSIYIVILSFIPCENKEFCCIDGMNNVKKQHKQVDSTEHNPTCPCSPFFSCGSCTGVVLFSMEIDFLIEQCPVTSAYFNYEETEPQSSPQSVWQPPKTA